MFYTKRNPTQTYTNNVYSFIFSGMVITSELYITIKGMLFFFISLHELFSSSKVHWHFTHLNQTYAYYKYNIYHLGTLLIVDNIDSIYNIYTFHACFIHIYFRPFQLEKDIKVCLSLDDKTKNIFLNYIRPLRLLMPLVTSICSTVAIHNI